MRQSPPFFGCTTIGYCSFGRCSSLTNVQIPNGCNRVGISAFAGSSLEQVVIPNGREGGDWAYQFCRYLTTVTIGTGCTSIGVGAFNGCNALASVTVPATLKSIGTEVFEDCPALTTIAVPKGWQIHANAFDGSCGPCAVMLRRTRGECPGGGWSALGSFARGKCVGPRR
jgi:hypothetical protein